MALIDLQAWIEENHFSQDGTLWCIKRLSSNDTSASGGHQAGPYLPKTFLFEVFPEINRRDARNPDADCDLYVDSHIHHSCARVVWYNQGTRDEVRLTRLGGSRCALLDPDSTGAVAVFSFSPVPENQKRKCRVWVCDAEPYADLVEDVVGPVEPGRFLIAHRPGLQELFGPVAHGCHLAREEIPPEWMDKFPNGKELVRKAVEHVRSDVLDPDARLLLRRSCEFEIFQSVEEAHVLPAISAGFSEMRSFLSLAQTVLQRRRARAGRSLELHTRHIFEEEELREGRDFAHGVESEPDKRPDFLFPSKDCYDNTAYPRERLRMLAVKTSCRDRWRQVITEADKVWPKHLLTEQRGVSVAQMQQMKDEGIQLVVPAGLIPKYPEKVRAELVTLEDFIADLRLLRRA